MTALLPSMSTGTLTARGRRTTGRAGAGAEIAGGDTIAAHETSEHPKHQGTMSVLQSFGWTDAAHAVASLGWRRMHRGGVCQPLMTALLVATDEMSRSALASTEL